MINKKIDLKFSFLVLALLGVILCFITIQMTYARYITSLPQSSYVKLGSWLLTINDQNVIQNSDISELIVPNFSTQLEDVKLATNGKIVPTSKAYVELILDYSKVSTLFKYELTINQSDDNLLSDLKITDITVNDEVYTPEENNLVTFTLDPTTSTTQTIRFYIQWDDSESDTTYMNDIVDTKFAKSQDTDFTFLLNIKFTQVMNVTEPETT